LLNSDRIRRFWRGELDGAEARDTVRELLIANETAPEVPASHPEAAYDAAFERATARALAAASDLEREARAAVQLASDLESQPFRRALTLIRNHGRYRSLALSRALAQRSFQFAFGDPARYEELARLAVEVAASARITAPSQRLAADVEGAAWTHLGNALRIRMEHLEAERSFERAAQRLAEGTGDPLEEAQLFAFQASLAFARGSLDSAVARARGAARLYRSVGETHLEGRSHLQEAIYCSEAMRFEEALQAFAETERLVDFARDPDLEQMVAHNLAMCLEKMGRLDEARERMATARRLAEKRPLPLTLLRVRWAEARLAVASSDFEEAERALREACAGFVEHNLPHEGAGAGLELALVLLQQGRVAELRSWVADLVPIFEAGKIHPELEAARELVRAVQAQGAIEKALLLRLSAQLEVMRRSPGKALKLDGVR